MFLKAPRHIYIERLDKFIGKQFFADVNLTSVIYDRKRTSTQSVQLEVFSVPDLKRIDFKDAIKGQFRPASVGDVFGPAWSTHWFKVTCKIPQDWVNEEVHFIWDAHSEVLIYTLKGEVIHALTGTNNAPDRCNYILTRKSVGGETFEFYLEMACNGLFGNGNGNDINPPEESRQYKLQKVEMSCFNRKAYDLWLDFQIIIDMAKELPANSQRAAQALFTATTMANTFKHDDPSTIQKARSIATEFFRDHNGDSQHHLISIGHCHIDTAWLWPYDETKRKVARSWASQCYLMDQFPEYKFACSQAQQYEWLMEHYPGVFKRVQEKAKSGNFIPVGGTWVEMDGNVPSGESFVRQFLYGQRYFEKYFGKRCDIFWLPDTFGYSSQLPQLVKQADMQYFFTQKLSWNNFNKFPHNSFYWVGLDGTKVLTHFAPADTYCSQANVRDVAYSVKNHKDREVSRDSLLLFGYGDGGGGPTADMLERLRRMKDLDGLPRVSMDSPTVVYKNLEKRSQDLMEWKGELYFELHRGTYTSQARNKKYNRKLELLMRNIELISAIQMREGLEYPTDEIDKMWKTILLNQFHDVLPGTSIEQVFVDSRNLYHEVEVKGLAMKDKAFKYLVDRKSATAEAKSGLAAFNSLSWARTEIVEVPISEVKGPFAQYDHAKKNALFVLNDVPSMGVKSFEQTASKCPAVSAKPEGDNLILENAFVRVTFNKQGRLTSLIDKKVGRELVPAGQYGNKFRLYEDIPLFWDAWDIEFYSMEKGWDAGVGSAKIVEEGPLRATILVEHPLTKTSSLKQLVSLSALSPRVDFDTEIDWDENRKLLKVEFPWDLTTDFCTYHTQYGWVQRPTHYNTSWDLAKFEVCAHMFMDMSEFGYGVSMFNDCKYGHSGYKNIMALSLLRSPKAPDANCDICHHSFKYAIYPHAGTFAESDVVRQAYSFNEPLTVTACGADQVTRYDSGVSYFSINSYHVLIDCVKKAEDSNDVIVRLYEAYGGRGTFKLNSILPVAQVFRTNILEDKLEELAWTEDGVEIFITPFQVVTLALVLKK